MRRYETTVRYLREEVRDCAERARDCPTKHNVERLAAARRDLEAAEAECRRAGAA
jgi:hypothetical protein